MDTIEDGTQAGPAEATDGAGSTTGRARELATEVVGAAPAVLGAARSTAGSAYAPVRRAPDEQLALGTAFAAGLVAGLVLARVPRPLLMLALIPLAVIGGTLLGRKVPIVGRALGAAD